MGKGRRRFGAHQVSQAATCGVNQPMRITQRKYDAGASNAQTEHKIVIAIAPLILERVKFLYTPRLVSLVRRF